MPDIILYLPICDIYRIPSTTLCSFVVFYLKFMYVSQLCCKYKPNKDKKQEGKQRLIKLKRDVNQRFTPLFLLNLIRYLSCLT